MNEDQPIKPMYEDELTQVFCADAFQMIGNYPTCTFDMVLTDPAYWTLDKWRNVGTTTRLGGHSDPDKQSGWFKTIDLEQLGTLIFQAIRVLKVQRHAYIMADGQCLHEAINFAIEAGWANYKPIVWDKVHIGMGYHYRCRHEFFLMLDKAKNRKLNNNSTPDIWSVPFVKGGYPTEKPVALMEIPISHSTDPGDLILDPFCGGGATLVAAKRLGRRAVGIDINSEACKITAERLAQTMVGI